MRVMGLVDDDLSVVLSRFRLDFLASKHHMFFSAGSTPAELLRCAVGGSMLAMLLMLVMLTMLQR